jgi:hypothetical protein
MEIWGIVALLYMMITVPALNGIDGIGALPWENKAMAGLFVRVQPPVETRAR